MRQARNRDENTLGMVPEVGSAHRLRSRFQTTAQRSVQENGRDVERPLVNLVDQGVDHVKIATVCVGGIGGEASGHIRMDSDFFQTSSGIIGRTEALSFQVDLVAFTHDRVTALDDTNQLGTHDGGGVRYVFFRAQATNGLSENQFLIMITMK